MIEAALHNSGCFIVSMTCFFIIVDSLGRLDTKKPLSVMSHPFTWLGFLRTESKTLGFADPQ